MKLFLILLTLHFLLSSEHSFCQDNPDEIIFYSNGSTFSPLIIIDTPAEILWIFDDNTTSPLPNPVKNYGSEALRVNRLVVDPWSAVRGINIGYNGADGGSALIPYVPDQKVSKIQNLELVASNLELWCSSGNLLDSLNFDNFINLETIECFQSKTVQKVSLKNTPNLKRLCLEDNDLKELDVSECTSLKDLRAALNDYKDVKFPDSTTDLWHICIRDNPQITNPDLFSDMSNFPNISELFIWNCNQSGGFALNKTFADSIDIIAYGNNYTSLDLSGALQNENGWASVDFQSNDINNINISGCDQIRYLKLGNNNLIELNISDCTNLEYLNGSSNNFTNIIFPDGTTKLRYINIANNLQIANSSLFSYMEKFPYISNLIISNTNQIGKFQLNQTSSNSIYIDISGNKYTVVDFSGAFQNENGWAKINLNGNLINRKSVV
jgi:hypothetical protein